MRIILPSIFKPNENLAGEVFATILERCGVSMEHDAGLGVGKGASITGVINKHTGLCSGTTTGSAVTKNILCLANNDMLYQRTITYNYR